MELITKKMQMLERKCEAVNQITFDEDFNVPDVKPDIGRMIQKKGEIQIEDIQISQGKAFLSGALMVSLLYCKFCSNGTPILKSSVHSF